MKGAEHSKLWSQLEAEIHLHRHKTVIRACRGRVSHKPNPPSPPHAVTFRLYCDDQVCRGGILSLCVLTGKREDAARHWRSATRCCSEETTRRTRDIRHSTRLNQLLRFIITTQVHWCLFRAVRSTACPSSSLRSTQDFLPIAATTCSSATPSWQSTASTCEP